MSYTYATYTAALANLMAYDPADADFVAIEPSIIDYAENRIYRELQLLSTIVRDSSATVTANSRNFTLPSTFGRFVTVDGINIYTPVSTTTTRVPLTPVSRDVIDWSWPSDTAASASTVPNMFCWVNDGDAGSQTVILGSPPGAAFTAEVIGTIRPTPLSVSNTTSFLSQYLPDLFMAASMIFASGYMRNFSAQGDDPRMSQSWENQFKLLLASSATEEGQKKFASVSWTPKNPEPNASNNQRG